ncbi:lateral flagellin LafA [Salmonella enterica]|nr:lateral flagellin LafA [Salmonella enterica]
MLSINTNKAAMAAINSIDTNNSLLVKSMTRLATGKKINSSSDDAAGKQIANRLQSQSDGQQVAQKNISDATSIIQTADSALDTVTKDLTRMRDLATQAANGTNSQQDVEALQTEYNEIAANIYSVLSNTSYGGTSLFSAGPQTDTGQVYGGFIPGGMMGGKTGITFQTGSESSDVLTLNINKQLSELNEDLCKVSYNYNCQGSLESDQPIDGETPELYTDPAQAMEDIDTALSDVGKLQSALGSSINRLNSCSKNLQTMNDNLQISIGTIMDTDYAKEASNLTKYQLLTQTSITMLKQSQTATSLVSSLLN